MKNNQSILLAFLGLALFLSSCESNYYYIEGNGNIISKTLELEKFTGINMTGAEDVIISYGEEQHVSVTGDANIIEFIKTGVYSDTWFIELERGKYRHYSLRYYITLPQINEISNDGAAKVIVEDFVNQGDLGITINGAGDIELNRMENTENLYVTVDGAGVIRARGEFPSLKYLDLNFSGTGSFSGYPAVAEECRIEIDGAAKCEVSVESKLDIFIDGAGIVHYKGSPSISQQVSGLGGVSNSN